MGHEKMVLKVKFIALTDYINILERSPTSNLTTHLKVPAQKEVNTPKRLIKQEILKMKVETKKYKENIANR